MYLLNIIWFLHLSALSCFPQYHRANIVVHYFFILTSEVCQVQRLKDRLYNDQIMILRHLRLFYLSQYDRAVLIEMEETNFQHAYSNN